MNVRILYVDITVQIQRTKSSRKTPVTINQGKDKGYPLSPVLFNVYIDDLIKKL